VPGFSEVSTASTCYPAFPLTSTNGIKITVAEWQLKVNVSEAVEKPWGQPRQVHVQIINRITAQSQEVVGNISGFVSLFTSQVGGCGIKSWRTSFLFLCSCMHVCMYVWACYRSGIQAMPLPVFNNTNAIS